MRFKIQDYEDIASRIYSSLGENVTVHIPVTRVELFQVHRMIKEFGEQHFAIFVKDEMKLLDQRDFRSLKIQNIVFKFEISEAEKAKEAFSKMSWEQEIKKAEEDLKRMRTYEYFKKKYYGDQT